jgi:hypothetical protein
VSLTFPCARKCCGSRAGMTLPQDYRGDPGGQGGRPGMRLRLRIFQLWPRKPKDLSAVSWQAEHAKTGRTGLRPLVLPRCQRIAGREAACST